MNLNRVLALVIVGLVLYIMLTSGGNSKVSQNVTAVDSIKIVSFDTTYFDSTRIKYLNVPVTKNVYDTSYFLDTLRIYTTIYTDTVRDDSVSIYYKAEVDGVLTNLDLGYILTFPVINKTETILVKETVQKPLRSLYLGIDADITNFNLLSPNALFCLDNGYAFGGGYDLKNKSIIVSFKKKIF